MQKKGGSNAMEKNRITRRDWLASTAASLATLAVAPGVSPSAAVRLSGSPELQSPLPQESDAEIAERARRMKWWHEARFGMFIHWGLYSVMGRHEWVMENEGIPVAEYEQLATKFKPKPYPARAWAKLAKATGQKY